ncbi:hypothetical protein [Chondrinema litorale]|uniref:hypothetical protein n=1 Tax=Chondrinema litorale TaxID=2994555 RepID=UPI0025427B99|nr:hypothetical protein [Chondrinema litorale]UZR95957.1 hypothetical protein OQ292_09040 [Chondrinema litorale]
MELSYTNREISEMGISELMKIAYNPVVVKSSRQNAIYSLDNLIKEHYALKGSFSPICILPPDKQDSLIKLWIVLKNKAKPEGWTARYFSYDFPHERELFKDKSLLTERLKNENSEFVKNFYGINKPLTGFKKLYDYAMKMYRQGKVMHMHFYLNNYYDLHENGEQMPVQLYSWSIANTYNREEHSNVVQM